MATSTTGAPDAAMGITRAQRAVKLRDAADLVEQFAPEDDERQKRDKVDILRRLGLLMANLSAHTEHATCRRCGTTFVFNPGWYAIRQRR